MKGYTRFLLRCLWVIGIPPLLLLIIYIAVDPFMVLRQYDDYLGTPDHYPMRTGINKGMISLRNYTRHAPEEHYNAFILGSSVSVPYRADYWVDKLTADPAATASAHQPPTPGDSVARSAHPIRPVHFDSASESVRSLRLKLEYLQRTGADLRHALIVVPPMWLTFEDSQTPPYINMPEIDPEVSRVGYHWMYLRSFYNREFLRAYVMAKIMGRPVRVGTVTAIDSQPCLLDPVTNEETHPVWDDSVRMHPREFYSWRPDFAKPRVINRLPAAMTSEKEADLRAIARILHDQGTDYAVVIGPTLYKQLPAETDLAVLRDIFGDRLHDMSQSMAPRADTDTCFFDFIHYRYPVACEIMDSIYRPR